MTTAKETQWFVAPEGNDAWSGQLPAPDKGRRDGPFRTLKKAAEMVRPGQTCFLRKGVYRETLRPACSGEPGRPLIFRNYKDEEAVISGADVLGGWTAGEGRIMKAPMDWDLEDQNQVFAHGVMLDEARWPHNTGTLLQPTRATAEAGTAGTLTDAALPGADGAWNGALLWCAGGDRWVCWSEPVTGFDARTHTLTFRTMEPAEKWYVVRPGSAYVLMGARAALEAEGEWWYDRAGRQLLLIPPRGSELGKVTVEAKRRQHCIDLAGISQVHIIGLKFRVGGVWTDDRTTHILLSRCTGEYVAHSYRRDLGTQAGVLIKGSDNEVNRCELAWSSTSILRVEGRGHRIVNCYLHDGNYGGKWNGAVVLAGRRQLFSHNTVRDSGRDLISTGGLMESLIQYNDLSRAGWLTCDLGILYGHSTDFMNTVIRRNVVHDNHAAGCALGIYFDHCSHNAIVCENVVYNTAGDPIRVNNPSYFDLVVNNTCFASGAISTYDHTDRGDLFGLRLANNLFNQAISLPAHVVLDHNLISRDPGYEAPEQHRFTLRRGSAAVGAGTVWKGVTGNDTRSAPDVGAFPVGRPPWRVGHDFAKTFDPAWEPADLDWMNLIHNACFELDTLEGWSTIGAGEVALTPGNGWGNTVYGSKTSERTGTSGRELRLGKGPARVEQTVSGLYPGTAHTLSGWFRVSEVGESVCLGVRRAGGEETWSEPVHGTEWTRVTVEFVTGQGETEVTVVAAKTAGGAGYAFCDNFGLPRASAGTVQHD